MSVRVKDLPENPDEMIPHVVLYCRECGEYVSATRGDYFRLAPQEVLTHCGVPLVAVYRKEQQIHVKLVEGVVQPPEPTLEQLLDGFDNEVERASANIAARGKGGQQVSFFGDFANAAPSVLGRLRWWSRSFRQAAQLPDKENPNEG